MRLLTKIAVGLVIALAVVTIAAVAALFLNAPKPEHPVGFQQATVLDPQDLSTSAFGIQPTPGPG